MPNYDADTEWNDILREKEIIPQIKEETIIEMVEEAIADQAYKPLQNRNLDELDELEDEDLEDSRILSEYRSKRIEALLHEASNAKYGSVEQICKAEYSVQVTQASKTVEVVVLLFQASVPASVVMEAIITRLACKYKATKFLKILADMCIENYPDKNVPTLLIYSRGELKEQIVGLGRFGGFGNSLFENVELVLKTLGSIPRQLIDSSQDEGYYGEDFKLSIDNTSDDSDDDSWN